jgi:hypothetical protein
LVANYDFTGKVVVTDRFGFRPGGACFHSTLRTARP